MTPYYHFAGATLRDKSPLPRAGDVSPWIERIFPCHRGWHMSARALDALGYAPGPNVALVEPRGVVIEHGSPVDKIVAQQRFYITGYIDATEVLRAFARWAALQVIHLWDALELVREYLRTGRADLRDATWVAARRAAEAASLDVTRYPARDASQAAVRAARAASWEPTRDAAWDDARAAAKAAAEAAVRDAAGGATATQDMWSVVLAAQNVELERRLTGILGR